jgi:hypothetical protein
MEESLEESKGSLKDSMAHPRKGDDFHFAAVVKETLVIHRKSALDSSLGFLIDLNSPSATYSNFKNRILKHQLLPYAMVLMF